MDRPIGIIGAMPEEIEALLSDLRWRRDAQHATVTLHRGRLDDVPVILAQCGIGKVNAAALTQLMILEGATQLVFTGVAGALDPDLRVGDIVVSSDALQHDLDVTALGYDPGQVPGESVFWRADDRLIELALGAARELPGVRVVRGRVASGDQFIADPKRVRWLRDTFRASCAEMEGAAMAQVAAKASVPWVVIRSISDTAGHDAKVSFREFTPLAASRAKQVVRGMLRRSRDDRGTRELS